MQQEFNPEEGPYNLDGIGVLLFNMIKIQREILEILKEDTILEGTTYSNVFTIPASAPVVKFDFVEAKHRNVPPNVSFEVPLVPVQQIVIKNLGGGILYYSTNKFLNQLEAASELLQGETREIKLRKRAIKQLNLAATGGACHVHLEMLV